MPSSSRSHHRRGVPCPGARTHLTSLLTQKDVSGYVTELHRVSDAEAGNAPLAIRTILFAQGQCLTNSTTTDARQREDYDQRDGGVSGGPAINLEGGK